MAAAADMSDTLGGWDRRSTVRFPHANTKVSGELEEHGWSNIFPKANCSVEIISFQILNQ
jgi:hypothetical protein